MLRFLPLLLTGCALFKLAATPRSHPTLTGTSDAPGADGDLTIRRDAHGVPHVDATSAEDAWYGLGFVHAQDRLFQADTNRHLARGDASAWFGERAVELDAFNRTMGIDALAAQALEAAAPETRAMIEAYTAGMNAGAASLKTLPIEYRLLDAEFEPWRPSDTLCTIFLMGWSLQENLDHELAAMAFQDLPSDTLDDLFQTYPDTPAIDPFWEDLRTRDFGELTPPFKAFTAALGGRPEANSQASNNWIVGGERTASGKPILANDPHLVQRVPSLWYAAEIHGGDVHVAGATFAGSPGFPVGHNESLAWGLTNVMADVVDLAVLEKEGESILIRGVAEPIENRTVTLHPRKGEPTERTVRWTSLGPIVNEGGDLVLVMRWAALEVEDHTLDMLHTFVMGTTAREAATTVQGLQSVAPQNIAIADVDGGYGWFVMGSIPRRHNYTGRVPYPASSGENHWDGFLIDRAEAFEPDEGYLATANHKPDDPSADQVATAYLPKHRYNRIRERLAELEKATPADMQALHLDVRDGSARTYLPVLIEGVSATSGQRCLELLQAWDHEATVDAVAPTVWAAFLMKLFDGTLEPHLDATQRSLMLDLMSTGRNPLDGDFDTFLTDRPTQVGKALDGACQFLNERYGAEENWAWGKVHQVALKHPFAAQSKLLSSWNLEPHPFPGSGATVAAADYDWNKPDWNVGFMASMRVVMPLDDLGSSTFVHPGGQSGQPKSPFYASHYGSFMAGETLPLWFDADEVKAHTVHTLTLEAR